MSSPKGLMERLNSGETIVCAEGYIFNFERRGYLKAGHYVPEVILEHPQLVRELYEEFVHAGSDVVLAFTYYAHRDKMSLIDRENDIESMNRNALKMARKVADETGTLMAGNICNSNIFHPDDPTCREKITAMFKEQILWAVEEGADYIVAETFSECEEALLAVKAVKAYGKGLPVVVTLGLQNKKIDGEVACLDGVTVKEAMHRLQAAGADVVGINCARGPDTMIPLLEEIKEVCKVPIAALPVAYRTTPDEPTMEALKDEKTGELLFPLDLDCKMCSRKDIFNFGKKCKELGIQYVGICCGNSAHYTRKLCDALGKTTPSDKYAPDLSKHCVLGTDDKLCKWMTKDTKKYFGVLEEGS